MLQEDLIAANSTKVSTKKFECNINYSSNDDIWYYCISSNDEKDIRYNSLWNDIKFKTQEECVNACQKYIDEVIKRLND